MGQTFVYEMATNLHARTATEQIIIDPDLQTAIYCCIQCMLHHHAGS